ncbi:MAG: 50S ribosomal protein L25/general stress protein Ctc [Deltaproteobacteria bacterium]|nr:50S ribosomal protein L25/general stress protein Ctc [Deltaproteobacteria bacterium]MBW2072676.1 50S ribosomal protein L25/general stress protein Ctc [Deltaproteobacteria bacterium]
METVTLNAKLRTATGKGVARALRRQGLIPAVFYGGEQGPVSLQVKKAELEKLLTTGTRENVLIDLTIDNGDGSNSRPAMIKEIQYDPVKRSILHVDFYAISMDRKIIIEVPIILHGEPAGLAEGGILQQVTRTLQISCLPGRIPESLELDVTHLNIGDSLHVSDLDPPEGVELLEEEQLTVVTVAAPARVEEEPEEVAEVEEGEEVKEAASETEEEGGE